MGKPKTRVPVRLLALLAAAGFSALSAQTPVLTGLEIQSGSRGVALSLLADGPFTAAVQSAKSSSRPLVSIVTISLANCVYGLPDYAFTRFDTEDPVKLIKATETGGAVRIAITLRIPDYTPIPIVNHPGRVSLLLSKNPQPPFTWKAPTMPLGGAALSAARAPAAAETTAAAVQGGAALLRNITVLQRGSVQECLFDFSAPVHAGVRREGAAVTALVKNAVNGFSLARFHVPPPSLFGVISVKAIKRNGIDWLQLSIAPAAKKGFSLTVQTFPQQLALVAAADSVQRFTFWEAARPQAQAYAFAASKATAVDIKTMGARAQRYEATGMSGANTFAVNEEPRSAPQVRSAEEEPAAPAPRPVPAPVVAPKPAAQGKPSIPVAPVVASKPAMQGKPSIPVAPALAEETAETGQLEEPADRMFTPRPEVGRHMVQYAILGRDPFIPLERSEDSPDDVPNVQQTSLNGILYDNVDKLALLENLTNRSQAWVVREREPVVHGHVLRIERDEVVFLLTELGISRTYTLKLVNETKE